MLSAFTAYFIIPIYTLLFVSGTHWFTGNLSVIGSTPERQNAFVLLGMILGFYFHTIMERILRKLKCHRLDSFFLHLALALLLLTVLTPYLPTNGPVLAFLHVCFAMTASLLLLFCLGHTVWEFSRLSSIWHHRMQPFRLGILGIFLVCLLLFLANQRIISTAMEVFFILAASILVQRLYEKTLAFSPIRDTMKAEDE